MFLRLTKTLSWAFVGLGLLVLFLTATPFLMLVAINWSDEELRLDVKQSLQWSPNPQALEENGYVLLWGIHAPTKGDAYALGRQIVQTQIKMFADGASYSDWRAYAQANFAYQKPDWADSFCDYSSHECVKYYLANRQILKELLPKLKVSENRLDAILSYRKFEQLIAPLGNSPFPRWGRVADALESRRIRAIYEIEDGHIQDGIDLLMQNGKAARFFLLGSESLLAHRIALSAIQKDMRVVSELIRMRPDLADMRWDLSGKLLKRIDDKSFNMKKAFQLEVDLARNLVERSLVYCMSGLDLSGRGPKDKGWCDSTGPLGQDDRQWPQTFLSGLATRFLFKPIQTLNQIAFWTELQAELSMSPAHTFDADKLVAESNFKKAMGANLADLFYPINPIGKILTNVARPNAHSDIEKHHDTIGYMRLVQLQLLAIQNRVPNTSLENWLAATPVELRNPYTLQPMIWRGEAKEIWFQGRQASNTNLKKSSDFVIGFQ